jgi:hypothetical protein
MESIQAWFQERLANVRFRSAGNEETNVKVYSANHIADESQDFLLNMLPVTFIQAIDDNEHWLRKTVAETWFNDQPLKLFGKGPVGDGRVFLNYLGDELLKFGNRECQLVCNRRE